MTSATDPTVRALIESIARRQPLTDVDDRSERLRRLAWQRLVIEPGRRILWGWSWRRRTLDAASTSTG